MLKIPSLLALCFNLTWAFKLGSFLSQINDFATCDIAHDAPLWDIFNEKLKETEYTYQRHEVTTEDGYILNMVRLIKQSETQEERAKRTPVLFQHGFTMTAENWLTVKPSDTALLSPS